MKELLNAGLIHGECMTVTGRTIEENLKNTPTLADLPDQVRQHTSFVIFIFTLSYPLSVPPHSPSLLTLSSFSLPPPLHPSLFLSLPSSPSLPPSPFSPSLLPHVPIKDIVFPVSNPFAPAGCHMSIIKGSLATDSAVLKLSGKNIQSFRGPVRKGM